MEGAEGIGGVLILRNPLVSSVSLLVQPGWAQSCSGSVRILEKPPPKKKTLRTTRLFQESSRNSEVS